jgi:hypothetical protein
MEQRLNKKATPNTAHINQCRVGRELLQNFFGFNGPATIQIGAKDLRIQPSAR